MLEVLSCFSLNIIGGGTLKSSCLRISGSNHCFKVFKVSFSSFVMTLVVFRLSPKNSFKR